MTASAEPAYRADRWWIVAVLLVLYMIASVDRFALGMIVDPMKRDLGLTDTQVSMLMGPAFAVTFVVAGFPAGWLVDRISRRLVVFGSVFLWAIAACTGGLAQGFTLLLVARMAVGIGEAGLSPAAHSIISDSFPRRQLASAISLFTVGVIAGTALSLGLGGLIIEAAKGGVMVPMLGMLHDWQLVMVLTALPGFVAGALVYSFREPERSHRVAGSAPPSMRAYLTYLSRRKGVAICYLFSFCVMAGVAISIQLWTPTYMGRTFTWTPAQYGVRLGIVTMIFGTIGKLMSGAIVDRLAARGRHDAHLVYYMVALALSLPMLIIAFFMTSPWLFLLFLMPVHLLMIPLMGFSVAGLMAISPNEFRGRTSALFLIMVTVMTGAGPTLVPLINAHLFADKDLRAAILAMATVGVIVTIIALQLGRASFRSAYAEMSAGSA